jgi:hypothetical protein
MIMTTTAPCISVQGAVVVVIKWWRDIQLHMSYITEIQGAVVVVIIWWRDIQLHIDHDGPLYFSNARHM